MRVQWYNGATNSYRMGREDKYDLKLAHPATPSMTTAGFTDSVNNRHDVNEQLHQCFPQVASSCKLSVIKL